jgi:hypothetical protein
MRHTRAPFTLLIAVVAALAVQSAPAVADAPSKTPVAGVISLVSNENLSVRTLGEVTRIDAVAQVAFSGDITGPATEHYTAMVLPTGTTLQRGVGSFEGDIGGRSGTLSYVFHGDAATGGVITIVGGTGELTGTHGRIAYAPQSGNPAAFDYEGTVTLR